MIAIASDHGGFELKNVIVKYLNDEGIEFKDLGVCECVSVDYPDYSKVVAEGIIKKEFEKGILVCGTGLGISIAANKFPGIRAAVCTDTTMARLSREHNDANILALGGRILGTELALDIVKTWLATDFSGEAKHQKRLDMITNIEKNYNK